MSELSRHARATREAIIEAALDLFLERKGLGFSMQEVADRAEVTHRTLYRYFSSRDSLLIEAGEQIGRRFRGPGPPEVSTVAEWIESAQAHFTGVENNSELFSGIASVAMAEGVARTQHLLDSGRDRDQYYWDVFRGEFPNLAEDDAWEWFAILRHLISAFSYLIYRSRFGFDPSQAAAAVRRASEAMVVEIRAADATREGVMP
jgi:AcrR family transcriptional regulator